MLWNLNPKLPLNELKHSMEDLCVRSLSMYGGPIFLQWPQLSEPWPTVTLQMHHFSHALDDCIVCLIELHLVPCAKIFAINVASKRCYPIQL